MDKFIPRQPDPFIVFEGDQELAKFGHINWLIRKNPLISEEIDFKSSAVSPNGRKTIVFYTNSTSSTFNVLMPQDLLKRTISILVVNSPASASTVTVSNGFTSTVLIPGQTALYTFVEGRWYVIASSGGGAGGGVQTVTGNIVDNTDPTNPVVTGAAPSFVKWLTAADFTGNNTPAIPQLIGAQIKTSLLDGDFEVSTASGVGGLIDPDTYPYTLNTITGVLTFPNGPEAIRILKYAK